MSFCIEKFETTGIFLPVLLQFFFKQFFVFFGVARVCVESFVMMCVCLPRRKKKKGERKEV